MGMWMQGLHGLEHAVLTLSVAFGARQAVGLSTWFGTLQPGPGLWTYRIWWHFLANVIGSVIFGVALYHLWRDRAVVAAAHRPTAPAGGDRATDRAYHRYARSVPAAERDSCATRRTTQADHLRRAHRQAIVR